MEFSADETDFAIQFAPISQQDIDLIADSTEIKACNAQQSATATASGFIFPSGMPSGAISANTSSAWNRNFTSGIVTLAEGRHITQDDQRVALVSRELAEENELDIGSELSLDPAAVVKIIGIYESDPSMEFDNDTIFTDHSTYWVLTESAAGTYSGRVDFFVTDPARLETVMEQVKRDTLLQWEDYTLQAKLKTRKKVCEGPSDLPHLFSGLFFCEACGSSMRLGYTQKRKYIYYSCARSTAIGSIACSTHYINFNTLYQVVQEDIKRNAILFSEDYEQATTRLMELKCADEQKQASKMQRELASAEKRLAELDVKLKRAYEDNINGKLPDHIFSMFISDYDAEKATLKATIADLRKSLEKVKDTAADIDRFAKLIQKYTSFEELDRFMLNELIDRITIYETPGMGRYRKGKEKIITIYNKFVGTLQ